MGRAAPLLVLLVATLLGALTAGGLNFAIGAVVAPPETVQAPVVGGDAPVASSSGGGARSARGVRVAQTTGGDYVGGILCRNLFDPEQVDITKCGPAKVATAGGSDVVKTDLKLSLMGTQVARPAEFSSALILEEGKPFAWSYGIGDKIYDAKVVRIDNKQVTLLRGNGREEVLMIDSDERPKPVASSGGAPEAGDGDITETSDGNYTVSRAMFDEYINDMEAISKMGRALLHRSPDGGYDGYRLTGLRRGSMPDKLGIRNGDIIHSVNGQELTSVQEAMNAYQTMQSQNNFCFDVTRRGSSKKLCYDLQ